MSLMFETRIFVTLGYIIMIYKETGWATAGFAFIVFVSFELIGKGFINLRECIEALKDAK